MNHAIVLNTKKLLGIQINTPAYDVSLFAGRPNERAEVAFDVNYSWAGIAIGVVKGEGYPFSTLPDKKDLRPCLCIKENGTAVIKRPTHPDFDLKLYKTVLQAGPTLLYSKLPEYEYAVKKEEFRPDAIRKTNHVAVGTTKLGKLIALYGNNVTLEELTRAFLDLGCLAAMKCDGGEKSFLMFKEKKLLGIRTNYYGNKAGAVVGLQFIKK